MENKQEKKWESSFELLLQFQRDNNHLRVPNTNQSLYNWLCWQRRQKKRNQLSKYRIQRLEAIGFQWSDNVVVNSERKLALLEKCIQNNGSLDDVDDQFEYDLENIGKWTQTLQSHYNRYCRGEIGRMSKKRFDRLTALGFQDTSRNAPVNDGGHSGTLPSVGAAMADHLCGQTDKKENATIVRAPKQVHAAHAVAQDSAESTSLSAQDPQRSMAVVVLQVESIDDAGIVPLHKVSVHEDWHSVTRLSYCIQRHLNGGLPENGFELPVLQLPTMAVNFVGQVVRYINDSSYTPAFETTGAPWLWLVSEALEVPQLKTDILAFLSTVSLRASEADLLDLQVCLEVAKKQGLNLFVALSKELVQHCTERFMHRANALVSGRLKRAHEVRIEPWKIRMSLGRLLPANARPPSASFCC